MVYHRLGFFLLLLLLLGGEIAYTATGKAASVMGPGITLSTTVGTDPHSCSDTQEITVSPGTAVTYCYTVTNNTGVKLSAHNLSDSVWGTLLFDYGYALNTGESLAITSTVAVTATTSNTATWRATSPMGYTIGTFSECGIFPDITATGAPLNLADDAAVDVALPTSFPFYDTYLTAISVSNNGAISTPGMVLPPTNEIFPNESYRRVIAAYWDDLDEESGNVYVGNWIQSVHPDHLDAAFVPPGATAESGPFSYFVVEWFDRPHYPGPSISTATFMVAMLYPGQGYDGYMFTCYVDTDFGDPLYNSGISATTGLNQNGVNAHLYSFNNADAIFNGGGMRFDPSGLPQLFIAADSAMVNVVAPEIEVGTGAFEVTHNPAPQFTTETLTIQNLGNSPLNWNLTEASNSCGEPRDNSWLSATPLGGSVDGMESINIIVGFDSTGLPDGIFDGLLCLSSNDEDEPLIPITARLVIANPGATPTPTSTHTPSPNATMTPTVTATATGPLDFHLYLPITRRR